MTSVLTIKRGPKTMGIDGQKQPNKHNHSAL